LAHHTGSPPHNHLHPIDPPSPVVTRRPIHPPIRHQVSFHKYGDYFFPGTGDITDVGEHNGR